MVIAENNLIWVFFLEHKYIIGTDSLIIRNFTYYDQGAYYCRAFITLRTRLLMKMYPIAVHLKSKDNLFSIDS